MTDPTPVSGELVLYRAADDAVRVEVLYETETFWLSQKQMSELFGVGVPSINEHLRNIFDSNELREEAVIRKFRTTAADGKSYLVNFYNLDAIISVGYRVNSAQATQFRIWATQTLREFITKGFVLDDERLKLNKRFGKDYQAVFAFRRYEDASLNYTGIHSHEGLRAYGGWDTVVAME